MKAKFFWGITILLSMVMLFACSSELLHEQEQQKLQNSDLIKEYSTLISQNKYGLLADLALSDQPDTLPNWKDLSQGELEAVMNLLADEFVKLGGSHHADEIPNWSSKDDYDLSLATSLAVNALVKKYLNKQVNQVSSGEVLEVIDNAPTQEFDALIRSFAKRENLKKLIDHANQKSSPDSPQAIRTAETRGYCSPHVYKVRTTIGGAGNVSCIGYAEATNQGDSDCDYEFTFPWTKPRTQPSLQLTTDSWFLMKVLKMGRINGRYHKDPFVAMEGDDTPDRVSFLIGKNRLRFFTYLSPGSVVEDLKGSWW